jgi:hypothetical protein
MSLTASSKSKGIADFDGNLAGHIETWVWTGVDSQTTTQTTIRYVFGFQQTSTYSDNQDFDAWINGSNVYSSTFLNNKGSDEWQFYETTKTYGRPVYGQPDEYQTARCRVDGIFDGPTSDTGTKSITTKVPSRVGTVLGAPTGAYWAAASSSTLTFNWSDPSSGGIGPVPDNMWVQLATDPGFVNLVANGYVGNVNTWTATGLPRASTYYFRVRAHNSVGDGAFSGAVGATTSPTVPDTMSAPTVLTPTTDGFSVQFVAPNNGGSAITSYEIQVSKDNFATIAATVTGVTSSPRALTGLSPGTKYRARVRAINGQGGASWSASSAEIQTLGGVKVWNGSAWIEGIVRTWDGTSWKVVVVRKWNGSSWVV